MTLGDIVLITVILLAFSVVTIFSAMIWGTAAPALNETLSQANGGVLADGSAIAINKTTQALFSFDQLFILMAFGSFTAIVISAYWINTHPIYFIISLVGFCFVIMIWAIMGTVFDEIVTNPAIAPTAALFPFMTMFWDNIELIGMLFAAVMLVILFVKIRGKGNGNAYSA